MKRYYVENEEASLAADPVMAYLNPQELTRMAEGTRKAMEKAAKELDFIEAARLRDEMYELEKLVEKR